MYVFIIWIPTIYRYDVWRISAFTLRKAREKTKKKKILYLAFLLRYCVLVSFHSHRSILLLFRFALKIYSSFISFIYNCRHVYRLIEMAIMQCFNGQIARIGNHSFSVVAFRLNAIISDDEFIFQFFASHAKDNNDTSRLQCAEKYICQRKQNIIMTLHLSLKYPQNLERFNCFSLSMKPHNENSVETKERTQTYSQTIICVLNAIRQSVCACYFIHWFEVCNFKMAQSSSSFQKMKQQFFSFFIIHNRLYNHNHASNEVNVTTLFWRKDRHFLTILKFKWIVCWRRWWKSNQSYVE